METFSAAVRRRRSVRAFTSDPIPADVIDEMLNEAALSPSNCNTQPWVTHLVRGRALADLSSALTSAFDRGETSMDYPFDPSLFPDRLQERRVEHGVILHGAQGTARDDVAGRTANTRRNLEFFGAPHALFLFTPHIADGVRTAADIGMFAQTFLLALSARGYGGAPQTMLGMYADTVRDQLGVDADLRLLFGISFGVPESGAPVNDAITPRDPVVVIHGDE